MNSFKDITIKDRKYRIGRVSAQTGSWLTKLILREAKGTLTERDDMSMHNHLLAVCSRYEADVPMPILNKETGAIVIPDLVDDLSTIEKLKDAAVDFNFADFFRERAEAVKAQKEAARDTETSAE